MLKTTITVKKLVGSTTLKLKIVVVINEKHHRQSYQASDILGENIHSV